MNKNFLFLLFLICSLNAFATDKAIYGADNRNEVYSAPAIVQHQSESIMGHVLKSSLSLRGSYYDIGSTTLGRKHCSSVKFSEQYPTPRCTGFLVAPNIVVTAGHCMKEATDCENYFWVLDYKLNSAKDQSYTKIPTQKVYSCKKLLAYKFEYFDGADYAIIELDRNVEGRTPLALDFNANFSIGTPLYVLGHPSGLPMKYTDSANLKKDSVKVFESDLDMFGGNSGSPVFDGNTNKVIGIVSKGHADWSSNGNNSCRTEIICTEKDNCHPAVGAKVNNMKEDFEKFVLSSKEN